MEKNVDAAIDNIFSNNLIAINGTLGAILIVVGIILLISNKRKSPKGKSNNKGTGGTICIGIGILVMVSGIIQNFM